MKKLIAIALAALMIFALAACGEDTAPSSAANPPASTTTTTTTAPDTTAPADTETSEPAEGGDASAPAAPSGSIVSEDGTITVNSTDLVIDVNGKDIGRPYYLSDFASAGVDVDDLSSMEVSSGSYFTPNIFLDENEDYFIVPNYYNPGDASVPITEAESETIGFATYASEPADQGVSIFGVKFGSTKSEVLDILGEPAYDDGDYLEWTVDVSDIDLDGTLYMYFTSDSDDGLVTDVYLSVVDYGW